METEYVCMCMGYLMEERRKNIFGNLFEPIAEEKQSLLTLFA